MSKACLGTIPLFANSCLTFVQSTSTCPYFNLAFENHLLNNPNHFGDNIDVHEHYTLLLYRNMPSVIIGRNQNPFYETHPTFLSSQGINLLRRWSGGGAVYHDLGNINYSFVMPRCVFNRHFAANLITDALNKRFGTKLFVNDERYDIWSYAMEDKDKRKVSGSAYRLQRERAYAHGTMLINTDLLMLEKALTPVINNILKENAMGVESVRSPVANLSTLKHDIPITHSVFSSVLLNHFSTLFERVKIFEDVNQNNTMNTDIEKDIEILKSWDWIYGKTPKFTFNATYVENGLITSSVDNSMIGQPFRFESFNSTNSTILASNDNPSVNDQFAP